MNGLCLLPICFARWRHRAARGGYLSAPAPRRCASQSQQKHMTSFCSAIRTVIQSERGAHPSPSGSAHRHGRPSVVRHLDGGAGFTSLCSVHAFTPFAGQFSDGYCVRRGAAACHLNANCWLACCLTNISPCTRQMMPVSGVLQRPCGQQRQAHHDLQRMGVLPSAQLCKSGTNSRLQQEPLIGPAIRLLSAESGLTGD